MYFEKLSSIKTVNSQPVSNLEKSFLKHGGTVTYIYRNKTFSGIIHTAVDALPEESEPQDSPEKQNPSDNTTACRGKRLSPHGVGKQAENEDSQPKQQLLCPSSRRGKRPQTLFPSPSKKMKPAGLPKRASKKAGWQKWLGLASYFYQLENAFWFFVDG